MRSEIDMLTYSLETEKELLPFLPALLQDIWALGSDVECIVAAVSGLNLSRLTRVIDLGCGKGAVSIAIAKALRLRVLGIDLFDPFVEECRRLAAQNDVDSFCEFHQGNIVELAGKIEPADVAIFAALGDTLGNRSDTMSVIRQYVRPGGFIIISDGYLRRADAPAFPGFETAAVREVALDGWQAQGDILVSENVELDEDEDEDDDEAKLIALRAEALAHANPAFAMKILGFAQSQADEYDFLAKEFVDAAWVFRRT